MFLTLQLLGELNPTKWWRLFITVLAAVAALLMVWRLWRHRHYTYSEQLLISGVILLEVLLTWGFWDSIRDDQSFTYRLPLYVVANVWIISVMMRKPSREKDNNDDTPD
jgi:hypothetical protein